MVAFRFLFILTIFFSAFERSYAQGKLQGCWDDITQEGVDPKYSPTHKSTTAVGTMICFKSGGVIASVHFGGFEALGSTGRFTYRYNQLKVFENQIADGWVFAHRRDRCDASVIDDRLQISRCKEWDTSRVMVLHRQTASLNLDGIAAGVFQ